jgi:hypothetical protein
VPLWVWLDGPADMHHLGDCCADVRMQSSRHRCQNGTAQCRRIRHPGNQPSKQKQAEIITRPSTQSRTSGQSQCLRHPLFFSRTTPKTLSCCWSCFLSHSATLWRCFTPHSLRQAQRQVGDVCMNLQPQVALCSATCMEHNSSSSSCGHPRQQYAPHTATSISRSPAQ